MAAKHIIGIGSETIDQIRQTSGSIITIAGDSSLIDQYILEIRGTTSQLQTAQQLIEVYLVNFIVSRSQDPPYLWAVFLQIPHFGTLNLF